MIATPATRSVRISGYFVLAGGEIPAIVAAVASVLIPSAICLMFGALVTDVVDPSALVVVETTGAV